MRLDNRLLKDSISATLAFLRLILHLFFNVRLIMKSTMVSPLGFIELIISYKTCIMKYTFRYSVAQGIQFYKMYLNKKT